MDRDEFKHVALGRARLAHHAARPRRLYRGRKHVPVLVTAGDRADALELGQEGVLVGELRLRIAAVGRTAVQDLPLLRRDCLLHERSFLDPDATQSIFV